MRTVIITMILSFMFLLYYSNNKYIIREEKPLDFCMQMAPEAFCLLFVREWEYYRMHFLRRRMIWINIIAIIFLLGIWWNGTWKQWEVPYGSGTYRLKIMLPAEQHTYGLYLPEIFQHIICMWMVFWSDRWEIRTRIIMWNGLRTECLPSRPILH